jgi:serine protease Do
MKKVLYAAGILFIIGIITANLNPTKPKLAGGVKENLSSDFLLSLEEAFVQVAERVKPAVVNLSTEKRRKFRPFRFPDEFRTPFDDFFDQFFFDMPELKQESLGSGVIIDERGYILTNYHVIKGANKIKVTLLDGRKFKAEIVGQDPKTDLALIKIKANGLPTAVLGDSDKVKVGSWAIAIGNPFGFNHTVTIGVISAKGRSLHIAEYENFLQTDASINPGNSGGPLVNIKGEVIGINTAIVSGGEGIGFAIPINMARKIIGDLIEYGKVIRAWLGIYIQDLTPELAEAFSISIKEGVLVAEVLKDSPAEAAGILRGDVIVAIDGKRVKKSNELQQEVITKGVGQKVVLDLIRKGEEMKIEAVLGEMPEKEMIGERDGRSASWCGMFVQELTPDLALGFGLPEDERGVVVSEITPGSPADEAGLKRGDIIKEIEREEIECIADFNRKIYEIEKERVLLLIKREGHTYYITIKTSSK